MAQNKLCLKDQICPHLHYETYYINFWVGPQFEQSKKMKNFKLKK